MPTRPLVLMAVHAHPDDEATSTGGVLAKYAAQGFETVLVTCTDGRCGDSPDGAKPGDPGHEPSEVVELRRGELEQSCRILGVTHLERLDYGDSGMMGWETNEAPGAFWTTPVADAAQRLAALMRRYRPDVVVTYDENGFYGHPDHIQAHRITMAAVDALADGADRADGPAKVYWTTVPRSRFDEFRRVLSEFGPESDGPDGGDEAGAGDELPDDVGLPDDEVTTFVDITDHADAKYDSLAAHASQSENIMFLRMGRELFGQLMGTETFVRVRDTTGASTPEDDLFAGLR